MIILKRQLYSYIEPEQREYNIISDLYHSGIKRTYKKNVGRIRRKVGDKLNKLKEETKSKYYEVVKKADYLDSKVPENKELLENLKDKIKSRGIDVFENDEVSKIYVKDSVGKNRTYIFRPSDKRIERAKQLVTEEKFKKDPNFKVIESIAKGRPVINLQGG